jgi:hypothetical protein
MGQGDFGKVFERLQSGLLKPLEGMGTAFSSSLLGLGGSLILGFLDIQAGHAQIRFYDGLEEWLTGVTNLGGRAGEGSDGADFDELSRLEDENRQLRDQLADRK